MYFRQNHSAIAHAAAAAGVSGGDITDRAARGVLVCVNITALTGTTPTLTVIIEGKDPESGVYFTILSSAALNANGMTCLQVYPGATVAANLSLSQCMPITWRIRTVIAGTTPAVTATVGVQTI